MPRSCVLAWTHAGLGPFIVRLELIIKVRYCRKPPQVKMMLERSSYILVYCTTLAAVSSNKDTGYLFPDGAIDGKVWAEGSSYIGLLTMMCSGQCYTYNGRA